jgi:hypothetical protein
MSVSAKEGRGKQKKERESKRRQRKAKEGRRNHLPEAEDGFRKGCPGKGK